MNALSAVVLILRRFRTEIGILLLLFVLIGLTSFLFAAAPRLFNRVSDDAMRYAAANALPVDRDVWLYAEGSIGPGTDGGVAAVEEYGQQREQDFPPSIDNLISDRFQGITSVRFAVPQSIVVMSLRYQDGLANDATLTEGRWPVDRGATLQMVPVGSEQDPNTQAAPTVFEIALSTTEADAIGVHVGDHLSLALDGSDPLIPKTVFVITPTEVEVVGLFEPNDSTGAEWLGSGLLQPSLTQGPDGPTAIHATAYIPATSYSQLAASTLPFHYDWHFQVDPQRLDADQVEPLQTDLQRLNLIFAPTDTRFIHDLSASVSVNNVSIGTGLLQIVDNFATQRARSESVLSIAALGLLGLAAGATAMVAILLVRRRRSSLLLARGRGASGRLVLGAQIAGGSAHRGKRVIARTCPGDRGRARERCASVADPGDRGRRGGDADARGRDVAIRETATDPAGTRRPGRPRCAAAPTRDRSHDSWRRYRRDLPAQATRPDARHSRGYGDIRSAALGRAAARRSGCRNRADAAIPAARPWPGPPRGQTA